MFRLVYLTHCPIFTVSRGQNTTLLPQENHQPAADGGSIRQVRVSRCRLVTHRGVMAERRRASQAGRRVLHAVRRQHSRAGDQPRRDEAFWGVHLHGHQQRGLGLLQSQTHSTRSVQQSDGLIQFFRDEQLISGCSVSLHTLRFRYEQRRLKL